MKTREEELQDNFNKLVYPIPVDDKFEERHKKVIEYQKQLKESIILTGEFSVIDSILSFTCHTKHTDFNKVRQALILVRDEINRQIENEQQCPYYSQS